MDVWVVHMQIDDGCGWYYLELAGVFDSLEKARSLDEPKRISDFLGYTVFHTKVQ
jgi:hypothetical protein